MESIGQGGAHAAPPVGDPNPQERPEDERPQEEREPFSLEEDKDVDQGDDLDRDDDGNLIDPPTLPEYERRIAEAQATGNDDLVKHVSDQYTEAREEFARATR